jgi:addiction module HigA family antidote
VQRAELRDCKRTPEAQIGQPVRWFCYPFGEHSAALAESVGQTPHVLGVTVDRGLVTGSTDPVLLPRTAPRETLRFVGTSWALAVPANRVSGIVNGTRAISADTALRLGKYFGTSPEIWLDLQSDYELRVARQTTWTRVEPTVQTRVA